MPEKFFKGFRVEPWQGKALLLMLYDATAIHAAYFLALWIRFDCIYSAIFPKYLLAYQRFITLFSLLSLLLFWQFRLYRSMWEFASYTELIWTLNASLVSSALHAVLITVLLQRMPLSYYLWGAMLQMILLLGIRFSYRFFLLELTRMRQDRKAWGKVMLIGAGAAGRMILRDINQSAETHDKVVCLIDDDPNKWNRYIDGVPVTGGREHILASVEKYGVEKIYLAIPRASATDKRDILNICSATGCELKQLPGIYQLVSGQVKVSAMREVSVEDLLGREPIQADMAGVFRFIHGKTVLVTGGGGSIGSELCRQIAAHAPKCLILFDIYENNAYEIQLELRGKYPDLDLITLIGSVRDSRKLLDIFKTYRPDIVYHAAAHKHVPLMEDSPCEAIKNNAVGTYKTAYAAMLCGCRRFVLISTDKAVNPTNIMGVSKRLCEMIVQSFDAKIKAGRADEIPPIFTHAEGGMPRAGKDAVTEFVAVRFGNVLGSNGSVIPVFKRQIAEGGPVTVTHPDIIRYFMTIPEAVSLVMLAGTYAHGGDIFVLDMGSPVKIVDLARNLIRLSGYTPDVDIRIAYTGLRPGEKLYEEKLMEEEGLQKTENQLIHVGRPIPFDEDHFLVQMQELTEAAYANREDIRERVAAVVSTYHPQEAE